MRNQHAQIQMMAESWKLPRPVVPACGPLPGPRSGVKFNVESVEPRKAPNLLSDKKLQAKVNTMTKEFYKVKEKPVVQPKLETSSLFQAYKPEVVECEGSGMLRTCMRAFANHHPLILGPDDVWGTITYGFARHVEENAEALREHFVQHEGKKVLVAKANGLVLGHTRPEQWERDIFPQFSRQIKEHIGGETHRMIAGGFSTTTATQQAAHEVHA
jgi:hypothetical protein